MSSNKNKWELNEIKIRLMNTKIEKKTSDWIGDRDIYHIIENITFAPMKQLFI